MAIIFSLYSSPTVTLSHGSAKGPRNNRLVMCSNNHISVNLQIRSYDNYKNKLVFEDKSAGIVCYKDENGEIICEGYDEGPRFQQQISRFTCNSSRDVEIVDLLQRCWLHVADENELENAKGLQV
ncbi:hypothetical protein CDL12_20729 [Handroanthus impetiginosus]|uniref:Uncharacterized protein n=1 Tax=Handroanthus impetiginosus TaxID=429701 RepID=A0A2G9GN44_9LAMI|nr:hypothetical protein CDL12_20729 [Handroanthus impetiginosus]